MNKGCLMHTDNTSFPSTVSIHPSPSCLFPGQSELLQMQSSFPHWRRWIFMLSAISQHCTPHRYHMHGCYQRHKDVRLRVCMTLKLSMCTKAGRMAGAALNSVGTFYLFGYKTEEEDLMMRSVWTEPRHHERISHSSRFCTRERIQKVCALCDASHIFVKRKN